ncbi:MAG: hypothetical protein MK171_10560 [Pirellulales bacterium]|nr:hypothetical protein [Pirellulales bacterium]
MPVARSNMTGSPIAGNPMRVVVITYYRIPRTGGSIGKTLVMVVPVVRLPSQKRFLPNGRSFRPGRLSATAVKH